MSLAPAVVFDVPPLPRRNDESAADYRDRARRESSLPYEADELDITRGRLDSISKQGGSVSPEALSKIGASIELAGPVLRRFDLDDLFDTDPDLAGGHTDVAPFVRALDRDVDAYVLWRRLAVPPDDQPPIHPDELCGVPFYEVHEAFAGQNVWILSLATNRRYGAAWRRTRADEVRAGDTVMVDLSAGCYTEASGWLGKGQRARTPRSWIERWEHTNGVFRAWARAGTSAALPSFAEEDIIDTQVDARRACGEDPRSYTKSWMELDHHLRKAEEHARDIVEALGLPSSIRLAVCKAASWHDVGKALEREADGETLRPFQNMLLKSGFPEDGEPREGVLYAKSNRRGGPPAGFRHEVASALAYLAGADADDLVAYLIIAHHGKVRLLPTPWDDDDPVDANGVRPGDVVPSEAIPETVNGESVRLDPSMFLASRSRSSWQGRIVRLLEELGPFGLAYLEALVRVADWRAS
jgi:CRISPR-associated endonuclease/helicase Cas3